ncbi:DUF4159 domain-containing protein [Candidatus Poribacteria bacterium]|nr:DUF4159 domain-containing protein [Candidatus Poribacteria bacterium]
MLRLNARTSQSFIASLVLHGIILFILGVYLVTQTQQFQDLIDASFLKSPDPPKPKVRKPLVKPIIKPTVPNQSSVVVEQVQPTPRVTTAVNLRTAQVATENVIEFSNRPLKMETLPQPHRPKVIDPNQPIPEVVTHVDLPTSDAPGALAFSGPAPSGGTGAYQSAQRGISGVHGIGQTGRMPQPTGVQSLLTASDIAPTALDSLVGEMRLGNQLMAPMHHSELGARIYTDPDTKRPTGFIQICYVRFRQLGMNPLFDVDPTALSYLVRWMAANTRLRTRIAGRTLYIDDMGILESPMIYLNGVRPIRLRNNEKLMLKRYLVEKGGFIFVDDDHSSGTRSAKTFANTLRAQFREIIFEAGGTELQRIPKDHPIWNQPFKLGGQPAEPNRTGVTYPMTAFELDGRLAVVISYNDYNNGWESPTAPVGIKYVVPVLRMGANFMFYAATHGKISDYEHYVPPKRWRDEDILLPKQAPQSSRISATGTEER